MPRLPRALQLAIFAALVGLTRHAAAQTRSERWLDDCRRDNGDDRERYCETRNSTLAAVKELAVDGRENGSVVVHGWDKNEIQVTAVIQATAETQADARDMAKQITISTSNGEIRSDGPREYGRHDYWSVSYEVWVPRQTDLRLDAHNGGITVENVASHVDAETTNGGIRLSDMNGDVRGTTVNGSVVAELNGDRWSGAGLDLRTTNGSVRLTIPANYSARLETGTVNGGLNIDFPVTVQGRINRQFTTQLGSGGAPIRATTTNGSVSIRKG